MRLEVNLYAEFIWHLKMLQAEVKCCFTDDVGVFIKGN